VAEYDADELADDSDDEKKIEKAEKAAERKAAMTARKKRSRSAQQQQPGNFVGHETSLLQNPQTGRWMATDCVFLVAKRAQFQARAPVSTVGSLATLDGIVLKHLVELLQQLSSILLNVKYTMTDVYDLLPVGAGM